MPTRSNRYPESLTFQIGNKSKQIALVNLLFLVMIDVLRGDF